MKYCTYLTCYKGNKLPPFYIGYTLIKNINKGYHGSVKSKKYKETWLSELKNNPHLFTSYIISKHKLKEDALKKEEFFHKQLNVVKSPLYINLSCANGKMFEYKSMAGENNPMYGKHHTEKTKKNLSVCLSGRKSNRLYSPRTPEQRKHHSEMIKGKKHTEETKNKISNATKGINNPMYGKTHTLESREKISKKHCGMVVPEERKVRISNSLKGRVRTKEHSQKISDAFKRRRELSDNNSINNKKDI